jgi:hippurate hydrolase
MLNERPGAYVNIGNGTGQDGGVMVHNPGYDFNDAALPHGASFWARLIETLMPRAA